VENAFVLFLFGENVPKGMFGLEVRVGVEYYKPLLCLIQQRGIGLTLDKMTHTSPSLASLNASAKEATLVE
jgi:hypothetical protein